MPIITEKQQIGFKNHLPETFDSESILYEVPFDRIGSTGTNSYIEDHVSEALGVPE